HTAALLQNCDGEIGTLRGLQNAGGHAVELLHGGLRLTAPGPGASSSDVAEDAAKGPQALPTGGERYFRDAEPSVAQQGIGLLDAPCQQVAMWRDAEGPLE